MYKAFLCRFRLLLILLFLGLLYNAPVLGQGTLRRIMPPLRKPPPPGYYRAVIEDKDTIPVINLKEIIVYPPLQFKNEKERIAYSRLVRDVKITLPYAKMVYNTLIETYEYIQTLPDEKSQNQHLKRMEKELFQQYKPELKQLTLTQGKLLIRLVDRECKQSSYQLVSAVLGKFRASFWNLFAGMFGANLKTEYDPKEQDGMTERVVVLVERGLL
jgi:hypothetical protein